MHACVLPKEELKLANEYCTQYFRAALSQQFGHTRPKRKAIATEEELKKQLSKMKKKLNLEHKRMLSAEKEVLQKRQAALSLKKELDDRTDDVRALREMVSGAQRHPDAEATVQRLVAAMEQRGQMLEGRLKNELYAKPQDVEEVRAGNGRWKTWFASLAEAVANNAELLEKKHTVVLTALMVRLKKELEASAEALRKVKLPERPHPNLTGGHLTKAVAFNGELLQGMFSVYKCFLGQLKHLAEVDDCPSSADVLSALQHKVNALVAVSADYVAVEKQVAELEEFKSTEEARFQFWRSSRETGLRQQQQQAQQQAERLRRRRKAIAKKDALPTTSRRRSCQLASLQKWSKQVIARRQSMTTIPKLTSVHCDYIDRYTHYYGHEKVFPRAV